MVLETLGALMATKGLETIASEGVKAMVGTHIQPLLQRHAEFKDKSCEIEECLTEYLKINYKKAMIMNTIVFRGIEKTLCDLYIPLTIVNVNSKERKEKVCIDDDCLEHLGDMNKILIIDTAGMGKSTIIKFLIIKYIAENKRIPVLIELRKVKENLGILDYIVEQFKLLGNNIPEEDVVRMLRNGDFVIFFDGYDEVENELKSDIMDNIQDFFLKAGENKYVITSREEADLNSLGDFKRFSIQPLSMQEAFKLIKLYDQNGKMSERLIDRIKNDKQLFVLKEFLNNAMLTSLIYKTFQYKEEIAYKKLDFYSQVYEALFNDHDKTKGGAYVHEKVSLLDSTDFERVLRRIAFASLRKNRVEYQNKGEFIQIIQEVINEMPWIEAKAEKVLHDLTHAVPFFQKDGVSYKWVHKSFMEYFAAGFICFESGVSERLLEKMTKSSNIEYYTNVLDFCYEIKPEVFRKIIIYPILCEYITYHASVYIDKEYESYNREIIEQLKYLSFISQIVIHVYENDEIAEKVFESVGSKREELQNDEIGKIDIIMHWAGEEVYMAHSSKNTKVICELLNMKNIDIFSDILHSAGREKRLCYDKFERMQFIVDDDPSRWYNSKENYESLSNMWNSISNSRRKILNKRLNYNKCVKLKKRIEKEIAIQEQIEIDLE